jgi:hypothetical protein
MNMKKLIIYTAALFAVASCQQKQDYFGTFGEKITEEGAVSVNEIPKMLENQDSAELKVAGKIQAVCQTKGCWMSLPMEGDEELFVKFKDYGFFMPKNSADRETIMRGIAYKEVKSVEELRHLAEDANKDSSEIANITEPEVSYTFQADGVIIK